MTDIEIIGNKLIVNFIGDNHQCKEALKYYKNEIKDQKYPDLTGVKYHKSWDWLMPIVDQCTQIGYRDSDDDSKIYAKWDELFGYNDSMFLGCYINEVWKSVVEFIQWYNRGDV